jgi:hypothetical protein
VVAADVFGRLKPETRRLGQDQTLERDRGQDAVEGADPIGGDQNAGAVPEIVVLADFAAIAARQLGDEGFGEFMGAI